MRAASTRLQPFGHGLAARVRHAAAALTAAALTAAAEPKAAPFAAILRARAAALEALAATIAAAENPAAKNPSAEDAGGDAYGGVAPEAPAACASGRATALGAPFFPPHLPPYRGPESSVFAAPGPLRALDEAAAAATRAADLLSAAATSAAHDDVNKRDRTWEPHLRRHARTLGAVAAAAHLAALAGEARAAGVDLADDLTTHAWESWFPLVQPLLGDVDHTFPPLPAAVAALVDAAAAPRPDRPEIPFPRRNDDIAGADAAVAVLGDPGVAGNLPGLPWDVRIVANAIAIRRAAQRERLAGREWTVRTGRLDTMDRLRPDPVSGRLARRRFVAFDPTASGHMIELVGDVAVAEGLALYVPGTGTNLDMSHVNTEVAENLVRVGGGRIACVVFLGGVFPQNMWVESGDPVFAETMAPRLVECGWDVQAHLRRIGRANNGGAGGRGGRHLPVTVIGHSFGGAVVGSAEARGLWAERVVYAASASAGTRIRSASQWRNQARTVQRFSLTAPGDPIELTQIWKGLRYPDCGWFDVMDGVQRLDTGFFGDGTVVFGTRGHGGILDADADSFWQIAAIVVGAPVVGYVPRSIVAAGSASWASSDGRLGPTALAQIGAQLRAALWRGRRDPRAAPVVVDGPGPLVSRHLYVAADDKLPQEGWPRLRFPGCPYPRGRRRPGTGGVAAHHR